MNIQSARYSPANMPGYEERCPLAKIIEYAFENEMWRFMQFIAIQLFEIELDLQSTLIRIDKFISVGIFSYLKIKWTNKEHSFYSRKNGILYWIKLRYCKRLMMSSLTRKIFNVECGRCLDIQRDAFSIDILLVLFTYLTSYLPQ